jgi:hypothetical protein
MEPRVTSTVTTGQVLAGAQGEPAGVRRAWALAVLVGLAGCDGRCGGSRVGGEPSPPTAPLPTTQDAVAAVGKPMKEVHVTLAHVQDIPRGELQLVDAPKYEARTLGKPKLLMEGKHLRLPDTPWPLAPDRGFVLVQDGPDYESNVLEARLIDLRSGDVLATLRSVYRSTYAKLGIGRGEAEVDGKLHEVLVHASDGQIVPLWPVEQAESRFAVINAGTGDAWVFEQQEAEPGAEEDPYPPYLYAYWADLRKRPPVPKEPFALRLEKNGRPPGGWLGPTWSDPAEAPLFLDVDSDAVDEDGVLECAKVELRPEGYECARAGAWAMAGGWRGVVEEDQPTVMSNAKHGELQVLEVGEGCKIEEVTLDPPRALLRCEDFDGSYLWSPEKVVRLPLDVVLGSDQWSRNRRVLEVTRHTGMQNVAIGQTWIDLVSFRAVHHHPVSNLTPYAMEQYVALADAEGLMILDVSLGNARRISTGQRCDDYSSPAASLPLFAYRCRGADESVKWIEAVDIERERSYRMPRFREAWLLDAGPAIVGLSLSARHSRVLRWDLD